MVSKYIWMVLIGMMLVCGCATDPLTPADSDAVISFQKILVLPADSFPELKKNIKNIHIEALRNGTVITRIDSAYSSHRATFTVTPGYIHVVVTADNGTMVAIARGETNLTVVSGFNMAPALTLTPLVRPVEPLGMRTRVWIPAGWADDATVSQQLFTAQKTGMPESKVTIDTISAIGVSDTSQLRQSLSARFSKLVFIAPLTIQPAPSSNIITGEFISALTARPDIHNIISSITRNGKRITIIMSTLQSDWIANSGNGTNNVANELKAISQMIVYLP